MTKIDEIQIQRLTNQRRELETILTSLELQSAEHRGISSIELQLISQQIAALRHVVGIINQRIKFREGKL